MIKYPVTKAVSKLGYLGAILFIILSGILGFYISKIFGLVVGVMGGTLTAVPLLILSEMAMAIVSMEENSKIK